MRKKIFVCSPLKGDIAKNIEKAKEYSKFVISKNHMPITPHIYFTQFLDDANEKEREIGIKLSHEMLKECHELWYFNDSTSEGMQEDFNIANSLNIPIIDKSAEFEAWKKDKE